MDLPKLSPSSSFTEINNSDSETCLILKKTNSSSQKNCIEFDFLGQCIRGESQNWSVCSVLPVFNKDKKYYTPGFILNLDKSKYEIRDRIYRSLHEDRIQSNMYQETTNIRVAKPFEFHKYCLVCKREFHDYRKHTHSESHKNKMLSSHFCRDIDQLCERFGNKNNSKEYVGERIKKTKKIKKIDNKVKFIQMIETKSESQVTY